MATAFIFPGQGSQVVGMGQELAERSAAARAIFARADAALGFALSALCFDGPAETLTATENAQPAIVAVSAALLAALAEADGAADGPMFVAGRAAFVAGHSLGEYAALYAAGVLELEAALRLVRRRGELMAQATEGTMAAILGFSGDLAALCAQASAPGEPVVVANDNSPEQQVVSGAAAAVERLLALVKAAGARRAVPLKVSAAFHSPLMAEAAAGLLPALDAAELRAARVPLIGNVAAEALTEPAAIRAELAAQVTAPVRWTGSVQAMAVGGVTTFVEVGPGNVLTGLIRRSRPEAALVNISDLAGVQSYLG